MADFVLDLLGKRQGARVWTIERMKEPDAKETLIAALEMLDERWERLKELASILTEVLRPTPASNAEDSSMHIDQAPEPHAPPQIVFENINVLIAAALGKPVAQDQLVPDGNEPRIAEPQVKVAEDTVQPSRSDLVNRKRGREQSEDLETERPQEANASSRKKRKKRPKKQRDRVAR
jgi:hypothetical protein